MENDTQLSPNDEDCTQYLCGKEYYYYKYPAIVSYSLPETSAIRRLQVGFEG